MFLGEILTGELRKASQQQTVTLQFAISTLSTTQDGTDHRLYSCLAPFSLLASIIPPARQITIFLRNRCACSIKACCLVPTVGHGGNLARPPKQRPNTLRARTIQRAMDRVDSPDLHGVGSKNGNKSTRLQVSRGVAPCSAARIPAHHSAPPHAEGKWHV